MAMSAGQDFQPLLESAVDPDPVEQFRAWFADAAEAGIRLPEAVVLATANAAGRPSARTVLLKGIESGGFVFFSNYESRKGRELAENPHAALVFYWDALGRQVRIEGTVIKIPARESEAYFRTRPFGSRIGAWASRQSEVIEGREGLEQRVADLTAEHPDGEVPFPPHWGGYRLEPEEVEFWQHRDDRLHDRLRYRRAANGWSIERLSP
jgi:pyridoxamine 5'-phosphate oxidase